MALIIPTCALAIASCSSEIQGTSLYTSNVTSATPTSTPQASFEPVSTQFWTERLFPNSPWLNHTAQMQTAPSSQDEVSTATSATDAPITTVTVGQSGQLAFSPSSLNATIGSKVAFNVLSLNHTLTQSNFVDPCRSNGGFDTGFAQFNPTNTSGLFIIEIEVTDLEPRWFFCAQNMTRSHCQAGMVFSLNPREAHADYLRNALAAVDSRAESDRACLGPPSHTQEKSHNRTLSTTWSARMGPTSSVIFPPIVPSRATRLRLNLRSLLAVLVA